MTSEGKPEAAPASTPLRLVNLLSIVRSTACDRPPQRDALSDQEAKLETFVWPPLISKRLTIMKPGLTQ